MRDAEGAKRKPKSQTWANPKLGFLIEKKVCEIFYSAFFYSFHIVRVFILVLILAMTLSQWEGVVIINLILIKMIRNIQ